MATRISGDLLIPSATHPSAHSLNDWLAQRLKEPKNAERLLSLFEKKLKDLTGLEITDLWDFLVKPNVTSELIQKDSTHSAQRVDSSVCTVDCIILNSLTSVSPLNASVVWDLARLIPPSDIQSKDYWAFAQSLKETIDHASAKPIVCVQLPHEKTRGMYWRMVFERNIGTLFSLTSARDNRKQIGSGFSTAAPPIDPLAAERPADEFWPLPGETCRFEEASIEVKQIPFSGSTEIPLPFEVLEFQITETSTQKQKTVRMIRYQDWGDGSSPTTVQDLQKFRDLFHLLGLPGGCAINCRASLGRSGTLAAFFIAKALQEAGIPLTLQLLIQIIEVLRKNRNFQMVQTVIQWRLLIHALTL